LANNSNQIIQSDNAVIDYTTISVIIDTLNKQQKAIADLQAAGTHSVTTVDSATGLPTTVQGTRKVEAGWEPIKGPTVDITYSFNSKPSSVVGTVISTSKTQGGYVYVSKSITATSATFTYVGNAKPTKDTKSLLLYWVAVGFA